jgi:hypothetical protein
LPERERLAIHAFFCPGAQRARGRQPARPFPLGILRGVEARSWPPRHVDAAPRPRTQSETIDALLVARTTFRTRDRR